MRTMQSKRTPAGLSRSGRAASCNVIAKAQRAQKAAQNHKVERPIGLDNDKLYTDASVNPGRQFGPVKAMPIKGQGRGLVLTAGVHVGELLLVSEPVPGSVVRAAEGTALSSQDVHMTLQRPDVLSDDDRRRLLMLFNGRASSASQPLDLKQLLAPAPPKPKAEAKTKGFGAPKAPEPNQGEPQLTPELLQGITRHNTWTQEYVDLGAAACRGDKSYAMAGLWPEHALLNHSCSPNTVTVLVGDRLLVRAVCRMDKDTHLTTNYLGFDAGSPVSVRRRLLEDNYSFTCNCPRCRSEASQPQAITAQLEAMWAWMELHGAAARQSVAQQVAGSTSQAAASELQALQQQVQQQVDQLELLLQELRVDPVKVGPWLRASAYTSYELLTMLKYAAVMAQRQQGGSPQPDPQPWAQLVPLAAVFDPAGDVPLLLAIDWIWIARGAVLGPSGQGQGEVPPEQDAGVKDASQACMTMHIARYGRVSDAVLAKLIGERDKAPHAFGRVALPSHLSAVPART